MATTTVTGVDLDAGIEYTVALNGGKPVDAPAALVERMPAAGTLVHSGPVGVEAVFDPQDPRAVYVWLHGSTYVLATTGPDLAPVGGVEGDDGEGGVVY